MNIFQFWIFSGHRHIRKRPRCRLRTGRLWFVLMCSARRRVPWVHLVIDASMLGVRPAFNGEPTLRWFLCLGSVCLASRPPLCVRTTSCYRRPVGDWHSVAVIAYQVTHLFICCCLCYVIVVYDLNSFFIFLPLFVIADRLWSTPSLLTLVIKFTIFEESNQYIVLFGDPLILFIVAIFFPSIYIICSLFVYLLFNHTVHFALLGFHLTTTIK